MKKTKIEIDSTDPNSMAMFDNTLRYAANLANHEMVDEFLENIDEIEQITFSPEHEKRMEKLFKKERAKYSRKRALKYMRNIAAAVCVVIILSAISIGSVQAWRTKFLNFIMRSEQTNTEVRLKEETAASGTYSNEYVTFKYIPEGFKLLEDYSGKSVSNIRFKRDTQSFWLCISSEEGVYNLDTENAETENIKINEYDGFLIKKDDIYAIKWSSERVYTLSGNLSKEELIKIAENVR